LAGLDGGGLLLADLVRVTGYSPAHIIREEMLPEELILIHDYTQ